MDLLLLALLAALPVTAILAVVGPPAVMASRQRWPFLAVLLWAVALLLSAGWVETSYRAGVRADEMQTSGNVFDDWGWLAGAALAALASVLAARTAAGRTKTPAPDDASRARPDAHP